jgi:hypothetical protein
MTRRSGITLIEVLVAIFVMGIGCIALLVLFPLGALTMAQGIRDDRSAQATVQASAFADAWLANGVGLTLNLTATAGVVNAVTIGAAGSGYPASTTFTVVPQQSGGTGCTVSVTTSSAGVPTSVTLLTGGTGYATTATAVATVQLGAYGPAYRTDPNVSAQLSLGNPVYIDAFAINVLGQSPAPVVGALAPTSQTAPSPGIPRVSPSSIVATGSYTAMQMALLRFTLLDDLTFNSNPASGAADTSQGYVQRAGRYSWAYLARRPSTLYPGVSDLAVVVYDGRSRTIGGGESYYNPAATTSAGSTTLTITYNPAAGGGPTTPPPLRRGSWILDASPTASTDPPDLGNLHAFFYRVVDITDTGTTLQLDLQTPLRAGVTTTGIIVVMENVADVFERRSGKGK